MTARRSAAVAWLVALLPAGLAVTMAALAVGIERGRAVMATTLGPDAFINSSQAILMADATQAQLDGLTRMAMVLQWGPLLCGVLAVALLAIDGSLARRSTAPSILAAVAAVIPPTLAGSALGLWILRVRAGWAGVGQVAPEDKPAAIAGALAAAAADLARARAIVAVGIVMAAMLAVAAAVVAARRSHAASARLQLAAVLLFAGAGAAFAATRALADDGRHPLAPVEYSMLISGKTMQRVPRVQRCGEAPEQAPILDAGDGLALDGRKVTPAELADELGVLRRDWSLLHPRDEPPRSVALLAPADRAVSALEPIFTAARAAGYQTIEAIVIVPHDVETRTLGRIPRASDCRRMIALDRPSTARPGQTWGDFLVHDTL